MKIAFVTPHSASWPAGSFSGDLTAHVTGLGRGLAARGHRVVIYTRKDCPDLPAERTLAPGLTVRHLPAGPAEPLPATDEARHIGEFSRRLAAQWQQSRPEIVHALYWTSGLAALLAARDYPVPVVQTFGSLATAERRAGLPGPARDARMKMEAVVARTAAGVLATSTAEASDLATLGIRPASVRVVPCGVETGRFSPGRRPERCLGPARLLHLAGLGPHDGADLAISLLAELPGVVLSLAGERPGGRRGGDLGAARLGKLAATLGVADRVSFTGPVTERRLPAVLRSADMLICTSRHDPLGLTSIRAMACGTPVAAIETGGSADAVIDGITGLLGRPGAPQDLARRLQEVVSTPMKLAAFGIAAADRARSRYPWERIAHEAAAEYESCIARQPERLRAA